MRLTPIKSSCLLLCTVFSFSAVNAMDVDDPREAPRQYLKPKEAGGTIPHEVLWLEDAPVTFGNPGQLYNYGANTRWSFPAFFQNHACNRRIDLGRGVEDLSDDNNDVLVMITFNNCLVDAPIRKVAIETISADLEEVGFSKTESSFSEINVPEYIKSKTENQYYVFHQHNYQDVHFVFTSRDEPAVARFFSVFADRNLIPDKVINTLMTNNKMQIKIEDFKTDINQLIGFINEGLDKKETAGVHLSSRHFLESALQGLRKVADPKCRAKITWNLIQEVNTLEYFDAFTLIQLCEQFNDKELPFFKEAKLLQADLKVSANEPDLDIRTRYIPSIHSLLGVDGDEARRARTTFANVYIGNGTPGNTLNNLDVSAESILKLLVVAQEQDLHIKRLEAELATLKGQQ